MDRREVSAGSLIELQPLIENEDEEKVEIQPQKRIVKPSAKIQELIKLLQLADPKSKSLVFSQFTSFLNLIEPQLVEAGIRFCRFDGSMPQKKREAIITMFSIPLEVSPEGPQVMLISLKSGALGLNLTVASQVFLLDPWWQSSIESQALDRCYRIGQTKPVSVFQLVAKDTVEDKVLEIQKRKQVLISQAFSGTKGAGTAHERREKRLEEIKELFSLSQSQTGGEIEAGPSNAGVAA